MEIKKIHWTEKAVKAMKRQGFKPMELPKHPNTKLIQSGVELNGVRVTFADMQEMTGIPASATADVKHPEIPGRITIHAGGNFTHIEEGKKPQRYGNVARFAKALRLKPPVIKTISDIHLVSTGLIPSYENKKSRV